MVKKFETINIDINDNKKIKIKKDDINYLFIDIKENGKSIDVSDYTIKAVFNAFGEIIRKECRIDDEVGLTRVILNRDMTSKEGIIQMEIIFKNKFIKVTTFTINLEITDKE